MKSIAILSILLVSSIAAANCPNLSDKYSCESPEGTFDIAVTQSTANNITTYTLNDGSDNYLFPADGIAQPIEDKENGISGTIRFVCEDNALNTYQNLALKNEAGNVVETVEIKQSMKRDESKNLIVSTTGKRTAGGQEFPIQDSFTCKLK